MRARYSPRWRMRYMPFVASVSFALSLRLRRWRYTGNWRKHRNLLLFYVFAFTHCTEIRIRSKYKQSVRSIDGIEHNTVCTNKKMFPCRPFSQPFRKVLNKLFSKIESKMWYASQFKTGEYTNANNEYSKWIKRCDMQCRWFTLFVLFALTLYSNVFYPSKRTNMCTQMHIHCVA